MKYSAMKKSTKIMFVFAFSYTFLLLPFHIMTLFYAFNAREVLFSAISIMFLACGSCSAWALLYKQMMMEKAKVPRVDQTAPLLQSVLMFSIGGSLCWLALRSFFVQDCSRYPWIMRQSLPGWHCGCQQDIPSELIAFYIIDPIVFIVCYCETRLELLLLWIIMTGSVLSGVAAYYYSHYIVSIILWTCSLVFFIIELHIQNIWLFLVQYQLKETLIENERMAPNPCR